MAYKEKGGWDKADIILKPVGGLLTALAVAGVGYFLNVRQATETDARVYVELLSKREEADTSLRKELFNYIIQRVWAPQSTGFEEKVLSLELLAYNFHESLDLAPLFKHVERQILEIKPPDASKYLARLQRAASDVVNNQIQELERAGGKLEGTIDFDEVDHRPEGMPVIEGTLPLKELGGGTHNREFKVEALSVDRERKEIRVKLVVRTPDKADPEPDSDDPVFKVGFFDFPMIDNIRLSHGQRCAIVFKHFLPPYAEISLICFPGSRSSLKQKTYYDEVMHDILLRQEASHRVKPSSQ